MNNKYSLKQIRDVWINAYLNGEADWLFYLETTSFFVKRNAEVITKAEQIKNIERNRTKLSNNKTGMVKFRETTTEIQEHKNWATVSGGACFERNGEIVSQCEFFELWLIVENRWKIASLCIEDID